MSDLINRDEVCLNCMIETGGKGCWPCLVKDAPTVDAEPVVHGHWIFEQDEKMSWCTKATCSNCREVVADNIWISVDDAREEFISEKRYCERCGAKMDEVNE